MLKQNRRGRDSVIISRTTRYENKIIDKLAACDNAFITQSELATKLN